MEHVWANNASSRLAYATDAGSPTVTVETLDGEKFPSPSGGQFFMVTVEDRRTHQIEIMRCTSRSGDVLTVLRAQEGTPAQSFLVGATISNRLTAGTLTDMVDFVNNSPGYTEQEADDRFVNTAGDTMTGPLTLYGNPVSTYMAATKNYVDMGLDGKASLHHTHAIADVVNLQATLDQKVPEAPLDGNTYARQSAGWVITVSHQEWTDGGTAINGRLTAIEQALLALDNRVTALENSSISDAPDDGVVYGRQSKTWAAVPPGTSGVLISDTPPIVPGPGYLWLESNTAIMYARVRDIDSEQWVQVNNPPSVGSGAEGIPDAPADGNIYGRQNNAWSTIVLEGYVGEAPEDGTPYNRQDAGWVPAAVPLPPLPEAPVDGQTYTRGNAQWQMLTWNAIPSRPSTFPPSPHTHVIADTTGLQTALNGKEPLVTAGSAGQYWNGLKQWTALPTPPIAADAPSDGSDYVRNNGAWLALTWANLDGKPTTFAPAAHTHPISEVVNLTSSLAAKEPTITAGLATQYWRGDKTWQVLPPAGISDAPSDGLLYGRKDAAWIVAGISFPEAPTDGGHYFRQGSTASWTVGNWTNLAGKPATFPPSAHTHTTSQITDFAAAMALKENTIAPGSVNDFWRGDKTWQPTPVSFPEAPLDGLSYLRKGSTHTWEVGLTAVQGDTRYLPTTGGTLTGDLSIVKASPYLVMDKAASAQAAIMLGRKAGAARWAMHLGDTTAEAGSNSGSNFKLEAYNDAGTLLGSAFEIARSSQILDFKRTPTVNGAPMIGGATISDTPPATPVAGQFWWESDSGSLLLRYTDANSSQWVQVNAAGLADAPDDAKNYVRRSKAWAELPAGLADAPSDSVAYGRLDGAWTSVLPLTGGTVSGGLNVLGALSSQSGVSSAGNMSATGYVNCSYVIANSGVYTALANHIIGWGGGSVWTTPSGQHFEFAWSGTTRIRIEQSIVRCLVDSVVSLGASSYRWTTVYASTGTINTSDEREKQDIRGLTDAEKRISVALRSLVVMYRWKDAVASKSGGARIHCGIVAQRVQEAFAAEGLDASQYGLWCSDPKVIFHAAVKDGDGNILEPEWEEDTGETRLGVRYDELLAFIIGGL